VHFFLISYSLYVNNLKNIFRNLGSILGIKESLFLLWKRPLMTSNFKIGLQTPFNTEIKVAIAPEVCFLSDQSSMNMFCVHLSLSFETLLSLM
jgi:hypothetical protein